jgi:hypothetical protein
LRREPGGHQQRRRTRGRSFAMRDSTTCTGSGIN